jgi:hypothetical protein
MYTKLWVLQESHFRENLVGNRTYIRKRQHSSADFPTRLECTLQIATNYQWPKNSERLNHYRCCTVDSASLIIVVTMLTNKPTGMDPGTCVTPWTRRGECGGGGTQLGRLERKPGPLYTLWAEVTVTGWLITYLAVRVMTGRLIT